MILGALIFVAGYLVGVVGTVGLAFAWSHDDS